MLYNYVIETALRYREGFVYYYHVYPVKLIGISIPLGKYGKLGAPKVFLHLEKSENSRETLLKLGEFFQKSHL